MYVNFEDMNSLSLSHFSRCLLSTASKDKDGVCYEDLKKR